MEIQKSPFTKLVCEGGGSKIVAIGAHLLN